MKTICKTPLGKINSISLEFKLQDLWIGVFWNTDNLITDEGKKPFKTDIWICLLPCLPIHIIWFRKVSIKF